MPDMPERPDWLAPLADPKSEAILKAAFAVFEEHGLHCATMLEVAKRARVSKETLYARFDSKEGLFYALIAWGARQGAADVEACANDCVADPLAALNEYAEALLTAFMRRESLAVYRMAVGESGRNPDIGRNFDELSCTQSAPQLQAIFAEMERRGMIASERFEDMHDALLGLLRGNIHHGALTGSAPAPSAEELAVRARRVVGYWMRAFAPASSAHAIAAE